MTRFLLYMGAGCFNHQPSMKSLWLSGAVLPILFSGQLSAAFLVNETFADGDRVGDTPPSSILWTSGAHNSTAANAYTTLSVASNQLTWDHTASAGVNSFSGILGHFTASGTPTTLLVGQTLRLSFTVAFSSPINLASTGAFRFALLNSNGSRVTTDFAGTNETGLSSGSIFSTWRGYEGQTAVSTAGLTNGVLTRERTGSGNGLFTSSNWGNVGSAVNAPASTAGTPQSAFLEITRTATGVTLQTGYAGAMTAISADNAAAFTSFDTIAFFTLDGNTTDIVLSNIQLDLIPEPSNVLLGGIGLASMILRRRR